MGLVCNVFPLFLQDVVKGRPRVADATDLDHTDLQGGNEMVEYKNPTDRRSRWTRPLGPLAFWLLLVAVWTAAFWPIAYGGETGGSEEIEQYESTVLRLHRASTEGSEALGSLSERQVNAYFDALLDRNRPLPMARRPVDIDRVRVDIGDGETELAVGVRLFGAGVVVLSRVVACAEPGDAVICLEPTRVGRLPLPRPLGWLVRRKLVELFAGLRTEREILMHVEHIEFADDRLELKLEARSGSVDLEPIRSSSQIPSEESPGHNSLVEG